MEVWFTVIGFILGTCLGSFAKALADRSLKNKSFWGRSYCEKCKHTLFWYDLFPGLSYLLLQGKCRYCHKTFSPEYLIVEVISGVLVGFLWWYFSPNILDLNNWWQIFFVFLDLGLKTFFITILIALTLTDLKKMLIPDIIVIPGIVTALILSAIFTSFKIGYLYYQLTLSTIGKYLLPPHSDYFYRQAWGGIETFLWSLVTGLAIGGFFLALVIGTKGKGMGGGDIKLGAFIGLILGFPNALIAMMLSFITGAVFGVVMILIGRKKLGQVIPFGPFMVLGSLLALFWGKQILYWYLQLSV